MNERPDIFLSYSRQDAGVTAALARWLAGQGHAVWWDQALQTGDTYDEVLEAALRAARVVLVLWTPASVASQWVRSEATVAQRQGTLLPVMLAPCDRPVMFELVQALDLSGWTGDADDPRLATLLTAVRRRLGLSAATPAVTPPPAPPSPPVAKAGTADRRLLIGGGVAALAALGGAGAWLWRGRADSAPAARQTTAPPSIVVLPFANLSGDPEQAWFADGIAEEIRSTLAQVPGLTVIGRVSSERFRDATDLAKVAQQLGVATILTGSVRRSASTVRISAQLIDGRTGADRWSQSYDRPAGDVLAVQEEIATSVVAALSVQLGTMTGGLQVVGSRNPEARELCIRAWSIARTAASAEDLRAELALLDRAIALDPQFVEAWALRSSALENLRSYNNDPATSRQLLEEQLVAARRTVALAPGLGRAHGVLATALRWQLDMAGARREAEAALKGPYNAIAAANAALVIMLFDPERAVGIQSKARADDPFAPRLAYNLAIMQLRAGDFAGAAVSAQRALALSNGREGADALASVHFLSGDIAAARSALPATVPGRRIDGLRAAFAWRSGNRAESDAAVARLEKLDLFITGYERIVARTQRGEREIALTNLEQALAVRCPRLCNLLTDPFMNPLRAEPRFQAVVARLFPADAVAAQARRLAAQGA